MTIYCGLFSYCPACGVGDGLAAWEDIAEGRVACFLLSSVLGFGGT